MNANDIHWKVGARALIRMPDDSLKEGVIFGLMSSSDENEDFFRVSVRTPDGREYRGCHPDCVVQIDD